MNSKSIFVLLFALVLSFSNVSASSYYVEIYQLENKALIKNRITLDKEQVILLELPDDFSSLSAKPDYSISGSTLILSGNQIEASYLTKSLLESSKDGYNLITKVPFVFDADNLTIKLILDEGYFVSRDYVFPKPSKIETNGINIILSWELNNVKEGSDFPIFVSIKTKSTPLASYVLILSVFIILAFIFYIIYKNIKNQKKSKKEKPQKSKKTQKNEIEKYLFESEKIVLNELKQADRGEMWQKQLQLKTNFSKAKLSRVIRNLESRNLIDKIPFGNTNKIRLK